MAKALQLPKQYHPDFTSRVRHPVGPVEIDWDNPLTNSLRFLMSQGRQVDLVSGIAADVTAPLASGLAGKSAQTALTTAEQIEFPAHSNHRMDGDFTLFATFDPSTIEGEYPGVISCRSSYVDGVYSLYFDTYASNVPQVLARDGSINIVTFSGLSGYDSINGVATLVVSCNSSASVGVLYHENVLEVDTQGAAQTNTANTHKLNIGGLQAGLASEHTFADYYQAGVIGRSLSEAECISLAKDPMQLLKPASPIYYFVPDAAPSGIAPIAGHHLNQMRG